MQLNNLFLISFLELFIYLQAQAQVVAHRGFWKINRSAQNPLKSLQKVDSINAYGSETDIWLSSDAVPIVNHDVYIALNNIKLIVQDTSVNILKRAELVRESHDLDLKVNVCAINKMESNQRMIDLIVDFIYHRRVSFNRADVG